MIKNKKILKAILWTNGIIIPLSILISILPEEITRPVIAILLVNLTVAFLVWYFSSNPI